MDRNDQVRKEPTLADLDAFEKLLRESLQTEPAKEPVIEPRIAAPVQASTADQAAMAELARLVDTPLDFEDSLRGSIAPGAPEPLAAEQPVEPHHHVHGSVEAALADTWNAPQVVEAHYTPQHVPAPPAAPEPLDPLAAFEEELRRFDAIRHTEHPATPVAAPAAAYVPPQVDPYPAAHYAHEHAASPEHHQPVDPNWYQEPVAVQSDYTAESRAESSLNAAEERLAMEAAAAAASAGASQGAGRSKGIFLALGGIAVAGLAVIGGSLFFGSGKKGGSGGDVPTIAARTEPTKEKPADPGGMEIPNLNKQVLASRNTPETKPAAVVNNTEQPLDLNQVTKRDSVRVIAPSPYQASQPAGGSPTMLETAPPSGASVEPRRVTSVKIPIGGEPAPAQAQSPAIPTLAGAAGASAIAAGASARTSTPAPTAPPVAPSAQAPTKVESRPVTAAQPRPETPKVAPPPKVATAPAATAPKATPPKNAPLSLNPPATAAATAPRATAPARPVTTGGAGGYAIQLASRPTESDAQSASGQLKTRYAATLGGRSPGVVSGEANGQTVYRVRVGGYSQADAVAACTKIKAAGGGCFVTKQ